MPLCGRQDYKEELRQGPHHCLNPKLLSEGKAEEENKPETTTPSSMAELSMGLFISLSQCHPGTCGTNV